MVMALKLITIATDGATDHVIAPDGCRYNLGSTPVARLVATLVRDTNKARMVLDEFLREGSSSFVADLDMVTKMFAPLRVRWAAETFPFMTSQNRLLEARGMTMADSDQAINEAINQQVDEIERTIGIIEMKAKEAEKGSLSSDILQGDVDNLKELVKNLRTPPSGQSINTMFNASVASLDVNARIAEDILEKIGSTRETVDRLASQGRRFNASAARSDLHILASNIHDILTNTDLAAPYLTKDLKVLASQTDHIHGLFAGAK